MPGPLKFKKAKQGKIVKSSSNKSRITIRIDNDILDWFREAVHKRGGGNYQTLINEALRDHISKKDINLEKTFRKILREELKVISK